MLRVSRASRPATGASPSWPTSAWRWPARRRVGILGHNGMGKTTLLRTLIGLLPATAGQRRARRRRHHPPAVPPAGAARSRLRAAGPRDLSRAHRARQPPHGHRGRRPGRRLHRGGAGGLPAAQAPARPARRRAERRRAADPGAGPLPLRRSRAWCCSTSRPRASSPRSSRRSPSCSRRSARKRGLAIVLVEQNLEFIRRLSDRVLIIQKGRITRRGRARGPGGSGPGCGVRRPESIIRSPRHHRTLQPPREGGTPWPA